uniref:NEDD8-activating enzyme E1 catalytic subunit n=1 Tax=Albugo laibachii Nc14 TaxID=890382 RepID=F0WXI0_9STRA|nr:ubiquitin activating enzyme putative [Albugo laibachii Nc14]|eukprot:CCA26173.1 ubiquitin activating enzyme putative [Albugo laibachii Nc14]
MVAAHPTANSTPRFTVAPETNESPIPKKFKSSSVTDTEANSRNQDSDRPMRVNPHNLREFEDIRALLERSTPFPSESCSIPLGEFDATNSEETMKFLHEECQMLIIGAGGLGCELLKNAVLSGFLKIHIIDMDTIDVSNLNRQFLFRERDIGRSKAECAAAFIRAKMRHLTSLEITPHVCRVQEMDTEFYRQFHVILCGLDNIEARRYVNSLVVSVAEEDADGELDPSTIIPLVDGGTEGLRGQARVIIPRVTSCFECSLESFPPQTSFPMCTIAETPRLPAHCIAYAYLVLWARNFPTRKFDKDSAEDMQWVYQQAKERAEQYGIAGVTYNLTLGVVKNIIPAVASTNAIIAAMCVNEAFKAMTYCSQMMNNYHMHMGALGCYSHTFVYEKKSDCIVCSKQANQVLWLNDASITLKQFIEQELCGPQFRLSRPSISTGRMNLFMQAPPSLREATSANLEKSMAQLVSDGDILNITDGVFASGVGLSAQIKFRSN